MVFHVQVIANLHSEACVLTPLTHVDKVSGRLSRTCPKGTLLCSGSQVCLVLQPFIHLSPAAPERRRAQWPRQWQGEVLHVNATVVLLHSQGLRSDTCDIF